MRDWIEKMHADDLARPFRRRGDLGQRNRRRVRGEDRIGLADPVKLAEQLLFQVDLLQGRLNHQIPVGEVVNPGCGADPRQRRVTVVGAHLVPAHQPVEALADCLQSPLNGLLADIAHHDVETAGGKGLGDAVAHGSGADDADLVDAHVFLPAFAAVRPRGEPVDGATVAGREEMRALRDPSGSQRAFPRAANGRAAIKAGPRARPLQAVQVRTSPMSTWTKLRLG